MTERVVKWGTLTQKDGRLKANRIHGLPPEERFWHYVDKTTTCWIWTAAKTGYGYGKFGPSSAGTVLAHRYAYELLVGPIPKALQLDHLCRTRSCVNPEHLEPVTRRINILRGAAPSAKNSAVTHCPQGHPYDLFNTYCNINGYRQCRACGRLRKARAG